tara:strand:+ start:87 stop:1040 length:954 start_codon:yes stop_codon:yes gene_type:complete
MIFDERKKKTFTKYWNNFEEKPKKYSFFSKAFRLLKDRIRKTFGLNINISIRKTNTIIDTSFTSYQQNKDIIKIQNEKKKELISSFLNKINLKFEETELSENIRKFEQIYYNSPVKHLGSGIGYNQALILFVLIKIINPSEVIESGVMRGFTTYIIDKATKEDTNIYCFDISYQKLEFKSQKAKYIKNDIESQSIKFKGENVLAYWDDHVSQLDRIQFSIKNNIKYNIFDDDLSWSNMHSDGWPPLPTMNMLLFDYDKVNTSEKIEWISSNRKGEIFKKSIPTFDLKNNVENYGLFPELFEITGYQNRGQTSFLKLK